jgi:nitrite reductase (NADH) large subunit
MAENIANYECEWANVLKDPVKLERFKPFLNTEEPDSHIRFTNEREQIKPAQCKGCGCR